jgi:hypothetical protein
VLGPKVLATVAVILCYPLEGCGQTPSHRQSEKKQIESNVQTAKKNVLPALGRFEGQILMYQTKREYVAVLEATVIYKVIPAPQDPTQTISVPRISGNLSFPLLQRIRDLSYNNYMELLLPMAGYIGLSFDNGDYDPDTHQLNLPYPVRQFPNEIWGQLTGELVNDVFSGKWSTRTHGVVGEFNLIRVRHAEVSP